MKKGQLLGLPLVLLFALIVGAMILFFGARFVLNLTAEADYVSLLDTIDEIDNNIDTFTQFDEGSSKVIDLKLPSGVEKICFYNPTNRGTCVEDGQPCSQELAETMQLVADNSFNVYVFPQGVYGRSRFTINTFQPEAGNPECISNGNAITITALRDNVGIKYYEQ